MNLKINTSLRIFFRRAKAFSIIQLLISLVITGVVLGGAFVLFGKWKANLSVVEQQERLREKASIGLSILKQDINSALRDNFDSRYTTFAGIETPGAGLNRFNIQAFEGSFAATLKNGDNFITIDSRYEDDDAAVAGFSDLVGFLQNGGQLVANIEGRQVMILRDSYAGNGDIRPINTNGTLSRIELVAMMRSRDQDGVGMAPLFEAMLAGRDQVVFRVTPIRKVTWLGVAGAQRRMVGAGRTARSVNFPNFKKLDIQYEFGVYDDWIQKSLPDGPQDTTLPYYVGSDGTNCGEMASSRDPRCVSGNDVTSILFTAAFTGKENSTYPAGNWQPIEGSSLLRDDSQDDYAIVISERVKPSAYFKGSAANASLVDPTCQVLNPFRCDPTGRCDEAFVDSDRNSPNWAGYKAGSPYCDCCSDGAGNVREDCESNPMDFGTLAGNEARLNSCAQAFGCGYTNPRYTDGKFDPAHYLACECILPDVGGDALHAYNPDNLVYETNPNLIGSGGVLEDANDFNLKCDEFNRKSCGAAAQALSPGVFGGNDIWGDVCSCRSFRVNANGVEVGEMYGHVADYEALCNGDVDLKDADGSNIACNNTIEQVPSYPTPDANGFYYRYRAYENSDGHPEDQRLNDHQQEMCACLKASNAEYGRDVWNLATAHMVKNSQTIPGTAVSAPNAQIEGVNSRTGATVFCADELSGWSGHPGGASCVDSGHFSGAQLKAALDGLSPPRDSSNALAQDAWAGWCDPKCKSITTSYGLKTTWDNARMALTGSATLADVPAFCHGPAGGGSATGVQ